LRLTDGRVCAPRFGIHCALIIATATLFMGPEMEIEYKVPHSRHIDTCLSLILASLALEK